MACVLYDHSSQGGSRSWQTAAFSDHSFRCLFAVVWLKRTGYTFESFKIRQESMWRELIEDTIKSRRNGRRFFRCCPGQLPRSSCSWLHPPVVPASRNSEAFCGCVVLAKARCAWAPLRPCRPGPFWDWTSWTKIALTFILTHEGWSLPILGWKFETSFWCSGANVSWDGALAFISAEYVSSTEVRCAIPPQAMTMRHRFGPKIFLAVGNFEGIRRIFVGNWCTIPLQLSFVQRPETCIEYICPKII